MIRVLEKKVSDKIAAGEVIERPVSIVKELMENAVDSGAFNIVCEIKNGGKTYIRVTDDGCGIPQDELETAFLRHATSKIETSKDLASIDTLGFRGEALASIAAVTRTSMITKPKEQEAGRRISISGGEVLLNEMTGSPDGTTVIVTDLFYNTPARREFLKNDSAETSQITDFLCEFAIAYPEKKISFISNGKQVFSSRGTGDLKDTILSVYKNPEYRKLIEINSEADGMTLKGLISRPSLSRTTRREQKFIVNGRVVNGKPLERAVSVGYRERLFEGRYPLVFLMLEIDPAKIDVNIHPNKKEVRFHNENDVVTFISKALINKLATSESVIKAGDYFKDKEEEKPEKTSQVDIKQILTNKRDKEHFVAEEVKEYTPVNQVKTEGESFFPEPSYEDFDTVYEGERFDFASLKATGCIFDTYITCEDEGSFYLIDQHAAHERVFYEKLVGAYLASSKASQPLLTMETIDVDPSLADVFPEWNSELTKMGYKIEEFGPSTYAVKEIPSYMDITEAIVFAKDFIDSFPEGGISGNRPVIDKLITKSCKSAVKGNDHLSMDEINALMNDLAKCRNPYSCPHGRPTVIRFTKYEIEKFFKRIQ